MVGICGLPALVSRRAAMVVIRVWAATVLFGLRHIMGVRVEVRGREHAPAGAALIGAKHMSMLDIVFPFTALDQPCFVLKQELSWLPVFGWYAWRTRMIPIDRAAHSAALKKLVNDTRDRLRHTRQIVIFPEGTRALPGQPVDYKPGVAALYRDLGDTPCHLIATNSGLCWPAKGIGFNPGVVVFEFLPPIPAGLKRGPFMQELQGRIEEASQRLIAGG